MEGFEEHMEKNFWPKYSAEQRTMFEQVLTRKMPEHTNQPPDDGIERVCVMGPNWEAKYLTMPEFWEYIMKEEKRKDVEKRKKKAEKQKAYRERKKSKTTNVE